jgi:hypothetical protein
MVGKSTCLDGDVNSKTDDILCDLNADLQRERAFRPSNGLNSATDVKAVNLTFGKHSDRSSNEMNRKYKSCNSRGVTWGSQEVKDSEKIEQYLKLAREGKVHPAIEVVNITSESHPVRHLCLPGTNAYGLRATAPIPPGKALGEYIGRHLLKNDANEALLGDNSGYAYFETGKISAGGGQQAEEFSVWVDASGEYGNELARMNGVMFRESRVEDNGQHANVVTKPVWDKIHKCLRLIMVTTRSVDSGEELIVDCESIAYARARFCVLCIFVVRVFHQLVKRAAVLTFVALFF